MIRKATHDDLPEILKLGAEFLAYSPYAWAELDPDAFATFAGHMIENGAIFLSDYGMIGGILSPLYFNPSVVLAAELFWWARTEGKALKAAFEAWAVEQGCAGITFTGLTDHHEAAIRRIYSRAGYAASEVAFVKRF